MEETNFEWEIKSEDITFRDHVIAGCLAGLIEHASMLPFDNIKTHLQVTHNANVKDTVKLIYNQGGFTNFYRGVEVVASGCMPAHAAYFSVYEISKVKFGIDDEQLHPYLFGLTGAMATFFHDLILTPLDVIKQRQQISLMSVGKVMKNMMENEGLFSLFRSFKITYIMNCPQAACLIACNESLKTLSLAKNDHNFASHFTCAGIAGGISAYLTTPFDVIKTKIQTQKFDQYLKTQKNNRENPNKLNSVPNQPFTSGNVVQNKLGKIGNIKYKNIMQTIKTIKSEDGYNGFYRGANMRMLAIAPSAAISWASYEHIKKLLQKTHSLY